MKISVRQLKQLIREQVEEMADMPGLSEARNPRKPRKPKDDAARAAALAALPDDSEDNSAWISHLKDSLSEAYCKAYELFVNEETNKKALDEELKAFVEIAGKSFTEDDADAVFRNFLGLKLEESQEARLDSLSLLRRERDALLPSTNDQGGHGWVDPYSRDGRAALASAARPSPTAARRPR